VFFLLIPLSVLIFIKNYKHYGDRMKYKIAITLLILPVFLLYCGKGAEEKSVSAGTSQSNSRVKWYTFNEGLDIAKKTKKHVIIDFYADWCRWCKVMENTTFNDSMVISELSKNFIPVRVYTDRPDKEKIKFRGNEFSAQEFSGALGVEGLPTVFFMDENGNLITKIPGFVDKEVLLPVLNYINKKCYEQKINIRDYVDGKISCSDK
jgi:thioredoxin-related protein